MQIIDLEMTKDLAAAFFDLRTVPPPQDKPCTRPSLLTVEEAAEYLGMSAKWMYRNYRDLPHVKIGGGQKPRIRFKESDLAGWVAAHTCDWRKQ